MIAKNERIEEIFGLSYWETLMPSTEREAVEVVSLKMYHTTGLSSWLEQALTTGNPPQLLEGYDFLQDSCRKQLPPCCPQCLQDRNVQIVWKIFQH